MEAPFFVPSKRARAPNNSSSSSSQVASCMVDGCNSDLSKCREYHRRHKVCELHSKTPKVTIRGQEQRFCQQCSRFHSLVEFDDAKRSCRKRLDGHNRRRRKLPQPDTTSSINSSSSTHYLLSNSNYEVANYVTSTAFLRSGLVGSSCSWGAAPENRAAELVRSSSSSSNHQHHHQANNNTVSSSFSDKKFPSFPFAGGGASFKWGQIHFPNFLQGSPRQEPPVGPTVDPPFLGRVSCDRALSLLSSLPPPLPQAEAQTEAEASSRKKVASGAPPPPPPPDHHHHQLNASLATQLGLLSGSGNATATANNMLVSSSQGGMMFQVRRRLDDDESSGSGSRPLHYPPSFSWE